MTSPSVNGLAPRVPLPIQPGLIHTPSTQEAAGVLEQLLYKDYVSHHCFFNDLGFHNHLPHHLVAAYDMGAPPALLKLIYEELAPTLRPLDRQGDDITESNWTTRLGERQAYGSYLSFFSDQLSKNGTEETMRKYVMAPEANGNGAAMLARFLGGALHPFLQVGFGAELGQDFMIAQGLAMGAVTSPNGINPVLDQPSNLPEIVPTTKGVTLLALLREVYDSPVLKPYLPYDPNALLSTRARKIAENPEYSATLRRIYAKWSIDTTLTGAAADAEFASKVEECLWQATLLLAATGRPNRAPRLDFFLMHVLTSALCLPIVLKILPNPVHKAQLLQAYARASALFVLLRGRPRIDIPLLMSYTAAPGPPVHAPPGGADALGNPRDGRETSPWLAIVQNALHHKDAHVLKVVRTLYYCGQRYGETRPGEAIGARDAEGQETHVGAGRMDGSIFVRAAGVVSDTLGWVAYGGTEGKWDRSALGWDAAWENEDARL
ncbi:hypothetical protein DFH07DRAFT_752245 [Mycena maculata]|uniref:Oxidoreductase AflY n=1 Tax=Mycena maculata TaxID=230809 RepID=A0AAD7MZS2_9AGAR|nr:hypothetical protein DFH07DRAFT_752245 [Mycena maculata]